MWICPECGHEWMEGSGASAEAAVVPDSQIRDVNGNPLSDGDTVIVVKELKVKGSTSSIKVGTKVKNIRLVDDPGDGHDISCKIDGFGAMNLKSSVVRKA